MITEDQGDRIIDLLEDISSKLSTIETNSYNGSSTTRDLDDIYDEMGRLINAVQDM